MSHSPRLSMAHRFAWLLVLALLGCASARSRPTRPTATSERRERIVETALAYATVAWTAGPRNVLHGNDANGRRVDTPDTTFDPDGWHADGRENHGVPYAWGGFTSIDDFTTRLRDGAYAGNVPRSERALPSRNAVGLDCSGFVARCWGLPSKQSTRSLGRLAIPLGSASELEPGDILNRFDSHVVLFAGWNDDAHTIARIYEAGRLRVEQSAYDIASLTDKGFVPMRYKPLDSSWTPLTLEPTSFRSKEGDQRVWIPSEGSSGEPTALAPPLAHAHVRQWARYRVDDDGLPERKAVRASFVANRDEKGDLTVERELTVAGGCIATGATTPSTLSITNSLVEFAGYEEPVAVAKTLSLSSQPGSYVLGERTFPALRIKASVQGSRIIRHQERPLVIRIDAIVSDDIPIHGVLAASFVSELTWRAQPDATAIVVRRERDFELLAFGSPRSEP